MINVSKKFLMLALSALVALAAACSVGSNDGGEQSAGIATDTLAPIVSMTPRFTATPIPSRTPLPTYTLTPSNTPVSPTPSDTPPPTATPAITGIVASLQTVNVRTGPGVDFSTITALVPGTGVEILGQNEDGRWLNIRMDDTKEGWIATSLVRINPLPTLEPTATPSPDLTAIALGTPLPTAVLGGGTITPTPPGSVVSPTPVDPNGGATEAPTSTFELPVINVPSIQQTATALAGGSGIVLPQFTATFTPAAGGTAEPTIPVIGATFTPSTGGGGEGSTNSQTGVDVLAYCDNRSFGRPAPTNLLTGATIDVFWSWYVSESDLIQQHLDNAVYDVKVDGVALANYREYRTSVRKQNDGNYYVYWYVPYGPLAAGEHKVTYTVSWNAQITDGYDMFGPGTNRVSESGSCTFTVR